MDRLDQLKAFVATAQSGSFTAAANQLGVSNRLTSKYVAELESHLGVRLLQRTTRRVGLTPAGDALLARAPMLIEELDALFTEVADDGSRGLSGPIRVSAPATFGEAYVAGMLGRFANEHPAVSLDLRLSDRHVDLASDGIDIAFRIGPLDTLSLKARKLGSLPAIVVASPDYIARHGLPENPAALGDHQCILDTNRRLPRRWTFHRDGTEFDVQVAGQISVNSARAASDLAATGVGIANIPRFAAQAPLSSGQLVPVLRDYESERRALNAVYLEGRALPRKIRALIDFAVTDVGRSGLL
ncbi:LysR family transcriptional regulator [Primorskyibacter sp. 2E107]|uniref:LysR family transcriptional regulator n=1 Tax=Primorskyibacter sp. 2E107 TaxID=3403458 RepID=UPI003AF437C2